MLLSHLLHVLKLLHIIACRIDIFKFMMSIWPNLHTHKKTTFNTYVLHIAPPLQTVSFRMPLPKFCTRCGDPLLHKELRNGLDVLRKGYGYGETDVGQGPGETVGGQETPFFPKVYF